MCKHSSSRNHRGKRLKPEQCLQVFLLVAVGIWLMYQLGQSLKRRAVAVEISGNNGELLRRRWLDRKSLIKFAGVASGISGGGIFAGNDAATKWEPRANKGREDEGEEDDGGLFGYGEGDNSDFHPENGEGGEDNETERSDVHQVNTTSGAKHYVAADGTDISRERNSSLIASNLSTEA